jgi:hypothetical protein
VELSEIEVDPCENGCPASCGRATCGHCFNDHDNTGLVQPACINCDCPEFLKEAEILLDEISRAIAGAVGGERVAMVVPHDIPSDVCRFAVVNKATGREDSRMWTREEAELHALLRNNAPRLLELARKGATHERNEEG